MSDMFKEDDDGIDFLENLIPDEDAREKIKNFDEETIMSLLGEETITFDEDSEAIITFRKMSGWDGIKILE